mgnify:CR=1 FL=1
MERQAQKPRSKEADEASKRLETDRIQKNRQACKDWKDLLMEIIQLSVEPKRTDLERALARFDGNHDGELWHARGDAEHE